MYWSHGLQHLRHKRLTLAFTAENGYTLGFQRRIAYKGSHAETRGVSDGGAISTLRAFRTFTNIPRPGIRTANFAALGSWSGVLLKNAESLRNSDALTCVAVPRRRSPAGLRDLFFASVEIVACIPWAQCFPHVRDEGWYHYSRCALRAAETPDDRLPKGLTCRFLRLGGRSSPHDFYFLANMQVSLSESSVANTFALWYNKSKELEEFQNNYAVKFPFAIASSSPGPRPEQKKGSAIP